MRGKTRHLRRTTVALAMLLAAAPLAARQAPAGLRAELIRDIEQLERKYIALAEAIEQVKHVG